MSSFGQDDLSHLSMSLHMELKPDVRHVQDRVFHLAPHLLDRVEVGTAGRWATARRYLRVFSKCTPYSRIRPALAVPYFFAASCPKRVCRNPPSIFGLFWTLPPVPVCTVQSWVVLYPRIMEKHNFREILIACNTIITRVQGFAGRYV